MDKCKCSNNGECKCNPCTCKNKDLKPVMPLVEKKNKGKEPIFINLKEKQNML